MIQNERLGYPIVVADDVRPALRRALRARGDRCVVLCDAAPAVAALARSLLRHAPVHAFALGERAKRLSVVERVLDALAAAQADRGTIVVGVGGGVASDLFGLASGLYMRGVPYMHLATSLVAMADASIGGKTAVDLKAGKNLAGVFVNPAGVFAQVGALQTLPLRSVREGLAEILKAALIADGAFFESLEGLAPLPLGRWPWQAIVARAVEIKSAIVAEDPHEHGARAVLNLGHTFGHAYESASGYRITHGAGVALGLRAAGLLALRLGRFSREEYLRLITLIALLRMPLRSSVDARAAYAAMQHDKKRRRGKLRFVVPNAIGDVSHGVEASARDVLAVLREMHESLVR